MEYQIKRGEIFVLKATNKNSTLMEMGKESVLYANEQFPISIFQKAISDGFYIGRAATDEEKEFCYWCYEKMDMPGCQLEGIGSFRKWKKANNLP